MRPFWVVALSIAAAAARPTTGQAAPWSFELPAGYTEQPGAAEEQLARFRAPNDAVSVDAQLYTSSDGTVHLTRITWQLRTDEVPTKRSLENLDRDVVAAFSRQASEHVSDSRQWIGDQLVAEAIDEAGARRIHQRRLYGVDARGIVHVLTILCAGPADQLAACEHAQETMQLALPEPLALADAPPAEPRNLGYLVAQLLALAIIGALIVWLALRRRRANTAPLS